MSLLLETWALSIVIILLFSSAEQVVTVESFMPYVSANRLLQRPKRGLQFPDLMSYAVKRLLILSQV